MTGVVFTFSLFCTALLQTDPTVLQQVELAPVRQIIDAVIPEAHSRTMFAGRQTSTPPVVPYLLHSTQPGLSPLRLFDGIGVRAAHRHTVMRVTPIRAPSV
ncbi:MAG: hypothetical protein RBU27_06650 [Bacteroidota bacterium]|jgi:hypothetical protein|nr:hypothetical protein [Bacteroidota bacterium]